MLGSASWVCWVGRMMGAGWESTAMHGSGFQDIAVPPLPSTLDDNSERVQPSCMFV
jgi:hypothetical protein